MKHHLTTLGFLGLAVFCYLVGAVAGAIALVAIGVVFEGWFWVRLVRGVRDRRASTVDAPR